MDITIGKTINYSGQAWRCDEDGVIGQEPVTLKDARLLIQDIEGEDLSAGLRGHAAYAVRVGTECHYMIPLGSEVGA